MTENESDQFAEGRQRAQEEDETRRRIEGRIVNGKDKNTNKKVEFRASTDVEIASAVTPDQVRSDARSIVMWEVQEAYEHGEKPDSYGVKYHLRQIRGAINRFVHDLPLKKKKPTQSEVEAGLVPHTVTPVEMMEHKLAKEAGKIEWVEIPESVRLSPYFEDYYDIRQDEVLEADGTYRSFDDGYDNENTQTYDNVYDTDGNRLGFYLKRGGGKDPLSGRAYIGIETEGEDVPEPRNVSAAEARQNRQELVGEFERAVNEMHAWISVLEKKSEQDVFSGDIKSYSEMFKRWGEVIVRAQYFGILFNLPSSEKGLPPLGKKIVTAFNAMREIAEGRAYAVFADEQEDGSVHLKEQQIPNISAFPSNKGLNDTALWYAMSRIDEENPTGFTTFREISEEVNGERVVTGTVAEFDDDKADLEIINNRENKIAAMAAHILFDVMDIDAFHSVAVKSSGEGFQAFQDLMDRVGGTAGADLATEFIKDSGKLTHIQFRRESERRGKIGMGYGHLRDHPRAGAGLDVNIEAVPILATHFLKTATIEVPALEVGGDGTYEKIKVTLDQRANGRTNYRTGERETFVGRDGKTYSRYVSGNTVNGIREVKEYTYEVVGIENLPWDTYEIEWDEDSRIDVNKVDLVASSASENAVPVDMFLGVGTFAQKIPNELQRMYAYGTLYEFFTNDKPLELLNEMLEPEHKYLKKLNKGVQSAMLMLMAEFEIDNDAANELVEYLRVTMLASPLASVYQVNDPEKKKYKVEESELADLQTVVAENQSNKRTYDGYASGVATAGLKAKFVLSDTSDPKRPSWARPKDKALYKYILINRRVPNPWELNDVLTKEYFDSPEEYEPYFEETYLDQYDPLYPYAKKN